MNLARLVTIASLASAALGCGDNLSLPPDRKTATDADAGALACVPNLDGKIDRDELAAAIGVPIHYTVNPGGETRKVDLEGKQSGGKYAWSLAADYADDEALVITPKLAKDQWYADRFPGDAFVTPFDVGGSLDNIGRITDDGLLLLGVVSHEEDPDAGQTLLIYGEPIKLLEFPVVPGKSFSSSGDVRDGMAQGLPYAGTDTYEVSVDGIGSLDLPSLLFEQVMRVRTKVTVSPAVGEPIDRYQVSFYAECFAEVARATSTDGATSSHFDEAAELRRLGF